jgi:hypothetical protein
MHPMGGQGGTQSSAVAWALIALALLAIMQWINP